MQETWDKEQYNGMIMSKQINEIKKQLRELANPGDVEFFKKVVPGQQLVYGVKTPALNAIAQQYKSYSFDLAIELWNSGALEERIIAIKILEKTGKSDPIRLLKLFKTFSTSIDNWAVCDGLGMQFLRSIVKTHNAEIFELAHKFNRSRDPWQRRLSLVMVEWYTRDPAYHHKIMNLVDPLREDKEYYVKKAVNWIMRNFEKRK